MVYSIRHDTEQMGFSIEVYIEPQAGRRILPFRSFDHSHGRVVLGFH